MSWIFGNRLSCRTLQVMPSRSAQPRRDAAVAQIHPRRHRQQRQHQPPQAQPCRAACRRPAIRCRAASGSCRPGRRGSRAGCGRSAPAAASCAPAARASSANASASSGGAMPAVQLRLGLGGAHRRTAPVVGSISGSFSSRDPLAVGQAQLVAGVAHQAEVAAGAQRALDPEALVQPQVAVARRPRRHARRSWRWSRRGGRLPGDRRTCG